MSLPSAAASFDGGATYGGGGSPPFSLVYFLVRLSLLLLLWLLQSSRHDEIRKLLLKRRRRRRRRSCCCFYGPIRESCVRWSRDLDISAVLILFPQSIYIYSMCVENPILHWWKSQYDISRGRDEIVVENLKWCFIFDEKLLRRARRRRLLYCWSGGVAFLAFLITKQLDFMHFASHVIHHVDKNQCSLKESIYCKICAKHHFISMYYSR